MLFFNEDKNIWIKSFRLFFHKTSFMKQMTSASFHYINVSYIKFKTWLSLTLVEIRQKELNITRFYPYECFKMNQS